MPCGFISCPEAELGAADGPEEANTAEAGAACSTASWLWGAGKRPQPLLLAGQAASPHLDSLLRGEMSVEYALEFRGSVQPLA